MPGELPNTTGYTYAVEFSADEAIVAGAKRVTFDPAAIFYLENFIGFPTGTPVPVGSYDRDLAAWVGSEDGRVIEILDIVGDLAELDVDGSGMPAGGQTLADLGITEEERQELGTLTTVTASFA